LRDEVAVTFTTDSTYRAVVELVRRLRPSPGRAIATLFMLLGAAAFEGATVGLLVPLLALLVTPNAGTNLPIVGALLDTVPSDSRVLALGVAIVALVVVKNALAVAGNASSGVLRAGMLIELRRQLLERVLHAPPATLERFTSGEITDVFVAEAYRVNRVVESCVVFFQRAVIALSYVAAMLVLSWRLTMAALAVGFVVGVLAQWTGRRVLRYGRELSKTSGGLGRQVSEVVGGLRVIRTTATETSFAQKFAAESIPHARADVGGSLALQIQQGVIESMGVVGAIALTGLAHTMWLGSGTLDAPRFLAFGFGLVRLLPALNVVYATQSYITATIGSIEHVLRWLDLPVYPHRPFGAKAVPRLREGIRFADVGFAYPGGHEPIRSLSLVVGAGETLAVVGPSGSGKSTLANLLLRLREPTRGTISFDGIDYWEFATEDFHRAVGFVDQEAFVFNMSIADNVACGRAGISREAIEKALRLVQLGGLIDRLPEGIDTVLAERGTTLSGGQRQRLAIARAVVVDPQVLVLDEPTSALDAETEEEVVRAIDAARVGRTTLIITHRPAAARHATCRLDLSSGQMSFVTQKAALDA
jgi:subfamily B ATP-binding cassette protein MsbA